MVVSLGSSRWAKLLGWATVALLFGLFTATLDVGECYAQEEPAGATAQEKAVAERFVQVLRRRPRPGTALDRVYGFHVQNGTLEEFIQTLDVPDDASDAGANRMILGLLQSQRGKEAAAAAEFKKAEELLPDDAACSFYLGRSLLAVGQTENAAAAMERAIERKPARNEALPIFTELGRIYGRAGQSEKALGVWTKLETLFPGDVKVGGQIARTFAEEGNVEEASKRYESLAKTARKDADKIGFAVQAAEMQRRLGKADEATASLEKILTQLRPGSWLYSDVRNRIEEGFLRSGDFDALANYYQKKLETTKDDLALQVRLGRVLVSAGRLDDAKTALENAIETAPDAAEVRLALIDVLVNKAEMQQAAKQYEKLAEQDSENPDYLLRWGQILLEDQSTELESRQKAASKVWQRLADARPKDAVTLSQIADRMRSIDQTDDAIALYKKSIEVDPASPQYREYLGEYLYQLDRKDEAIKAWQSIAEGDRRTRDSMVRLAEVFGTFKQPERSIAAWREAAEMDLEFGQELRFAKILRDAKEFDEALKRLDVAENMAETPEENEQLMRDRIKTFQQAGTLSEKIADLQEKPETIANLRQLALMQSAASQLKEAYESIGKALKQDSENIDLLIVSAEIAERQNRYADAAETFQKLATVHSRYRTNYLQRTANLQMRLGEVNRAMRTCEDLIDTNPARIDSYQFMATLAFRVGRDDQAITVLRRAMNIAPRDNTARKMLAASFASRYRTEEAIELYWQAMRYERDPDAQGDLVKLLAPLYDRKNDMATLIRRIEEMGREEGGDTRTTQLMLASAHEAVRDYGEARQAIDRLLAQQPRDVKLLESMVRLSDVADEVALAAEFQEKIVALADTPENRMRLVQLQLDADVIDIETALSQRVSLASDPVMLGGMIRSASVRGDMEAGIAICRAALRRDPGLWDVKISMAQMLLRDKSDKQAEAFKEAIAILDETRDADIPLDARPPTARKPQKKSSSTASRTSSYSNSPQSWSRSNYELMRGYRLGRYASRGYSSSASTAIIKTQSFGHARVLASMLKVVAVSLGQSGKERDEALAALRETTLALPPVEEIKDAAAIWEYRGMKSFFSEVYKGKKRESEPNAAELTWRLAELDPDNGASGLVNLLMKPAIEAEQAKFNPKPKAAKAAVAKKPETDGDAKAAEPKERPVLTQEQLELVVDLYRRVQEKTKQAKTSTAVALWSYELVLAHEFARAGQDEKAKEYGLTSLGDDAAFSEVSRAIAFHLRRGDQKTADSLVGRLLAAARTDTSQASSSSTGAIRGSGISDKKFLQRHSIKILDAFIARQTKSQVQKRRRGSSSLSDGSVRAYVLNDQNYYTTMTLKAPLSTELISGTIVSDLASLVPDSKKPSNSERSSLKIPAEILEHLAKPLDGAPVYEQKARRVLAAYAHWWDKRPEATYDALIGLCKDFPDDVDLQIERARLASELKQPRLALETLDSFDPLDSKMMVRKEMAAMNLASQIGDTYRAKQSAERLFGMRMDTTTQLALADQLRRLGMKDQAVAVLQRVRGGRSQSESTELQIANAFLTGGQPEAAAEVAYNMLRKLNSGRSTSSNVSYYRQRAVRILQSAKKLDALIETSQRRLKSTPKSMRARTELAELLTAAGRSEEAEKLWEGITAKKINDPRQMMARAATLNRAKKYKEAANMYLDAFEKDPGLFSNNYYEMTRAVQSAKIEDAMFTRLTRMSASDIPYYRIDELLRLGGQSNYSDAKKKFLIHALDSEDMKDNFYQVIRSIPESVRNNTPQIRQLMINGICRQDAFKSTANVWSISSYSGDGTGNGALKDCLDLLAKREQARARFIKSCEKAQTKDETTATGKLMLAMLDIRMKEKKKAATKTIDEIVQAAMKAQQSGDPKEKTAAGVSATLLWQIGQILEETDGVKDETELLIAIYRVAADGNRDSSSGIQYTPKWRLIKMLGKSERKAEAREYLLNAYKEIDHSSDNTYNPGYGDYQDLNGYMSIAKGLDSAGCPIDALIICQSTLTKPEKFELAKRWGGGQSIDQYKKFAETLTEKIDTAAAEAYLGWMVDGLKKKSDDDEAKDLMVSLFDLPISLVGSDSKSSFPLAVDLAKTTKSGKKLLENLRTAVNELAKSRTKDWTLPATGLSVAFALDSDDVSEQWEALKKSLPPVKDTDGDTLKANPVALAPLAGLYTPLGYAVASEHADAKSVTKEIADYIRKAAVQVRKPEWQVAVASVVGDDGGTLKQFLASVEASIQPGTQPSQSQVDACLKIAKSSAMTGDIPLSARALKVALSSGPPLRSVGTTSNDAFALNRNQSSPQQDQVDPAMAALIASVNQIIDAYSDATGMRLGKKQPKKKKNDDESTEKSDDKNTDAQNADNKESMAVIADALRSVVMPDSRMDVVFDYANPIVNTRNYDNFRSEDGSLLMGESALAAMCRASVFAGQEDALREVLQTRFAKGADKKQIASIRVVLAHAAEDSDAIDKSLQAFEELLDDDLPAADEKKTHDPLRSISSQMQTESYKKSELINTILATVWPLVMDGSDSAAKPEEPKSLVVTPEVARRANSLISRTVALINSDAYTMQRHRSVSAILRKQMMALAMKSNQTDEVSRLINLEIETTRSQYAGYGYSNEEDRENSTRQAISGLLVSYAAKGYAFALPRHLRDLVKAEKRPNFRDEKSLRFCAEVIKRDKKEQLDILKTFALGDEADDPILHWGAFVRYTVPPSNMTEAIERISRATTMPVCSSTVPVGDTLLLLADVAAELGQSESLAKEFSARSKSPTDDAAVAAAIIRLTGAKDDPAAGLQAIDPTLVALETKLTDERPTKQDKKLVYPKLALYLAARSVDSGLPKERAKKLLYNLLVYGNRGNYYLVMSSINQTMAKQGMGRTAGGKPESPLKHFYAMVTPAANKPETESLEPLYRISKDGVLSGTSGQGMSVLLLRYPITGTFTFSADVDASNQGDADMTYGGISYPPMSWNQGAKVSILGTGGGPLFPVPSVKKFKINNEGIQVSPEATKGICNGETYVTDRTATSFPWVGITHEMQRCTAITNIKLSGDITIPREVNLIDPTMRGWQHSGYMSAVDPLLPIGPKQKKDQIEKTRTAAAKKLQEELPEGAWAVKDGELHFRKVDDTNNRYDAESRMMYQRPLLDGETLTASFWWDKAKTEVHPSIGRLVLGLSDRGTLPTWSYAQGELAFQKDTGHDNIAFAFAQPPVPKKDKRKRLAKNIVPKNEAWNEVVFTRTGDSVSVALNGETIIEFETTEPPRPGFKRESGKNVRIRSIKLTGDWPKKLPENLLEK